jgi:UDP-N-acetylglucosamine 2-epimerase (non-hydrolysing)
MVHVEAGLRSFDDDMPEETNRRVTDILSDILFVSDPSGLENLASEGVDPERVEYVGNVMIDTLLFARDKAMGSSVLDDLGLTDGEYGLVTLHRPSNVDDESQLRHLVGVLDDIARDVPLVFPVHPRTRAGLDDLGLDLNAERWVTIEPVGYLDFMRLMASAKVVLSDSGGIQEETTVLGVRCVTLRDNTERPCTIEEGTNILGGTRRETILPAFRQIMNSPLEGRIPRFWDGRSAERIADHMEAVLSA